MEGIPSGHLPLNVEDRLPVLFLPDIPFASPGGGASRRRRPLIAFPNASGLSDAEIPWIGLYQSLDLRMAQILDSLDRLSRGVPLLLPRVVPVRLSERALTFQSPDRLEPGRSGSVTVELPTLPVREIGCDLRILECLPGQGDAGFIVTGEWVGLGTEMREALLQYLILRQRETLSFQGRTLPAP